MNCSFSRVSTPLIRCRVVCALRETMDSLAPIRALARVDLPTLGRPTMATNPQRKGVFIYVPDSKPRAGAVGRRVCDDGARLPALQLHRAVPAPVGRRIVRPRVGSNRLPAHVSRDEAHRMPLRKADYGLPHAWPQPYRRAGPGAWPAAVPAAGSWRPCLG